MTSDRVISLRRMTALLVAANIVSACILTMEFVLPTQEAIPPALDQSHRFHIEHPGDQPAPEANQYKDLQAAHLFFTSVAQDTKAAKNSLPPAPQGIPTPEIGLLASVISPDKRLAIFSVKGMQDAAKVAEGNDFFGWHLVRIFRDHVLVSQGERTTELYLPDTHASSGHQPDTKGGP